MRRSVDYKGRPQEQVSIEKITNKTSFSRGLEMISLAKLKRLDISAHNPNWMFHQIHHKMSTWKATQQTSKSVREIDRSLIVKIAQELVGCGAFGQFPGTVSKYYSSCQGNEKTE